jgi:hypothetical protein
MASDAELLREFFIRCERAFSQSARLDQQLVEQTRERELWQLRTRDDLKEKKSYVQHLESTRIALNQSLRERAELERKLHQSRAEHNNLRENLEYERGVHQDAARIREELWSHAERLQRNTNANEVQPSCSFSSQELRTRLEACERRLSQEIQRREGLEDRVRWDGSCSIGPSEPEARKRQRVEECTRALVRATEAEHTKTERIIDHSNSVFLSPSPLDL